MKPEDDLKRTYFGKLYVEVDAESMKSAQEKFNKIEGRIISIELFERNFVNKLL